MEDDLPSEYDVIVIGTGNETKSIILCVDIAWLHHMVCNTLPSSRRSLQHTYLTNRPHCLLLIIYKPDPCSTFRYKSKFTERLRLLFPDSSFTWLTHLTFEYIPCDFGIVVSRRSGTTMRKLKLEFNMFAGMAESIVAAAASRVGKKVLHLDRYRTLRWNPEWLPWAHQLRIITSYFPRRNDYYGGMWASFNFDALQKWLEECRKPDVKKADVSEDTKLVKQGETMIVSGDQFSTVFNIEEEWLIPE